MGFMDELKKLARPYAEDDDDFEDDFDLESRPKSRPRADRDTTARDLNSYNDTLDELGIGSKSSSTGSTTTRRLGSEGKVVNLHSANQMQVVLVKPDRFDNVSDIAEHLRSKHAVVLNLEATNKDISRRLVDFLSGCAYALDGKIKKIAISTYLITPCNVDIIGDLLDELENSGVYL